jgi:hypothetical protein
VTNLEVIEDWRYSDSRMNLRREALSILMKNFGYQLDQYGNSEYSNQSMYECAHDWVSQGNCSCLGIKEQFKKYYI